MATRNAPTVPAITGASCFLLTGATSIERILWVKNSVFWGSKLSDTINRAIQIDTTQTDGDILLTDCTIHGIDDLTADSEGIFHNSPIGIQLGMVAVEGGET